MAAFKHLAVSETSLRRQAPCACGTGRSFSRLLLAPVQAECQEVRKRKDLELQILTEPIRNWEGEDIKSLGAVLHMSQVTVHSQNCQVRPARSFLHRKRLLREDVEAAKC